MIASRSARGKHTDTDETVRRIVIFDEDRLDELGPAESFRRMASLPTAVRQLLGEHRKDCLRSVLASHGNSEQWAAMVCGIPVGEFREAISRETPTDLSTEGIVSFRLENLPHDPAKEPVLAARQFAALGPPAAKLVSARRREILRSLHETQGGHTRATAKLVGLTPQRVSQLLATL